jgi:putative salt-induced outer membrane protein YdiY
MRKRAFIYILFVCVGCQTGFSDVFVLKSGDVIHGKLMEDRGDQMVILHDDLGQLTVEKEKVVSVEVSSATTAAEAEAQKTEYFLKRGYDFNPLNNFSAGAKEKGWGMSLNVSVNNSYGNTDEQAWRIGGDIKHDTEFNRFITDFAYYRKDKNSETTDNKYSQGFIYDWLLPGSKWFYFAGGRYDYDEFESWLHRVNVQAGPGYRFIDDRFFTLDSRFGLGGKKEWGSEEDDLEVESMLGGDLSWQLAERQKISATTRYFSVVNDIEDYRTRSTVDWSFLLDRDMNLSFNIGLLHEYQAYVDPGKKKHDTRLFSGIQYNF